MEAKTINVIIIDDHPLIIEAYKSALSEINSLKPGWEFSIEEANSCDSANEVLKQYLGNSNLDLVFLDIKLPPATNNSHLSGEDLGIEIREQMPNAKIIIATTFNDNYRIQNIFKSINPEGFLIKSDISTQTLVPAITDILLNAPYYSKTVLRSIRKYISQDFSLDKWDRLLLYELSRGTKMKELPDLMPFSIGAIEKRKRHLKIVFGVEEREDRDLLIQARSLGFI